MEHRFTIARIASFLKEEKLSFLGFDLDPRVAERFAKQFPGDDALTDLDAWQAFEANNPQAFRYMYVFDIRRSSGS